MKPKRVIALGMAGKIYDIETIGVSAPFGTKFAW